jgi:hypothetical protein
MHVHKCFATLPGQFKKKGKEMEPKELLSKLELIEEQARRTLEEFPQNLTKERQRMIIALVKQMRWHIAEALPPQADDPEATIRLPS